MEHVFSCAFASAFILQEKKFVAKKKLFVNATFLLALCRRPYPLPFEQIAFWPWVIVGHGFRGHVALQHCAAEFA
jgi:hypothetical protein